MIVIGFYILELPSIPLHKFEPNSEPTLYLKTTLYRWQLVNESNPTSLITSTMPNGNHTILFLANGMQIIDNSNRIKSGDFISMDFQTFKPICITSIETDNNQTLQNNTSFLIVKKNIPECEEGLLAQQVKSFHVINQK